MRGRVIAVSCLAALAPSVVRAATAQVSAAIAGEDAKQTKYNVTVQNTGPAALAGFSARVYVDLSEVFAAGKTAACAERFDATGQSTCSLVAYSGSVYYAKLDFGAYSLAAGASVDYKITLSTGDFSAFWNPANDYSRTGLTSTAAVTTLIPVYQGTTRVSGTDPGGSSTPTPTPVATATPTPRSTLGPTLTPTPTPAVTPTPTPRPTSTPTPGGGGGRTVNVSNVLQLYDALAGAQPFDTIVLAPGLYLADNANLWNHRPAMASPYSPPGTGKRLSLHTSNVTITGPRSAVIDRGGVGTAYVFWVYDCSNVRIEGIKLRNGDKGIVFDNVQSSVLYNIELERTGDEGIHLRRNSSDNTIQNCDIHGIGVNSDGSRDHGRGESIYIGSANSNWASLTGGQPDRSHRNRVIGNRIWDAPAELVDIKEGTSFGLVEGNTFDGAQLVGGRNDEGGSWIDCKGTDYIFRNNSGSNTSGVAYEVQDLMKGSGLSGLRNVFENNTYVGPGPDYFIWIAASAEGGTAPTPPYHHNVVRCSNNPGGSALGRSNIPCTP